MLELLWLVPALPLAGFLILALGGKFARIIGVASVAASALIAILIAISFKSPYQQTLWTWIETAGFKSQITLHLDNLSLIMMLVITCVGFLIHLYSAEFMAGDEGIGRFFAYMNLFVASMLILVLAGDLLLLYLGWEAVGLCSYLLIGFWYTDPANGNAARKAFIVTRIGDTAFAIGLFLIFTQLGTLQIQEILNAPSPKFAAAISLLLLGGAVGKSAQLPLQVWLPDAMAGPSPVSALIHAATMVTAGVYLIARMNLLFTPNVQFLVAIIGAATLLLAAFSALAQHDIKRILAYSTISQIGYMFLALGIGAWQAAIFHFMTHAFFKALLFLGAGAVILALNHEHNIHKMGGLRKALPITFWTFLIAAASLSALPFVTAGFYSKETILAGAWDSNFWLWSAGVLGALLTSMYSFRLVFLVFFGEQKQKPIYKPGLLITIPLIVLAILSIIGGFYEPLTVTHAKAGIQDLFAISASLAGIALAYKIKTIKMPKLFLNGWYFDWLYYHIFVYPLIWISKKNKNDFIDVFYDVIAYITFMFHQAFSRTQTGNVRWYAAGITLGAIIFIAIVVLT